MPCGEFFDLIACYQIMHGAKERETEQALYDTFGVEYLDE